MITFNIAMAQTKLPFLGPKNFNFTGGSCCEQTITITKSGNCIIKNISSVSGVTVMYKGKYKTVMWTYENGKKIYGYKLIGRNKIMSLNSNGKPEECDEGVPCIATLF